MPNSVLKMPEENERVFRVFFLLSRCCSSSKAQRFKAVAIFFQVSNIAHEAITNYCSSSCRSFVASMKNPFFSRARYRPWNRPSSASMSSELALLADASIPEIIPTIVLFRLRLRSATGFFSLSVFPSLKSLLSPSPSPFLSSPRSDSSPSCIRIRTLPGYSAHQYSDPHVPVLQSHRNCHRHPVFPATRTKNLSTEKQTPNDAIAAATSNVLLLQQLYGLLLLPCVRKHQNDPKTVSQEKTQENKKKKNQMRQRKGEEECNLQINTIPRSWCSGNPREIENADDSHEREDRRLDRNPSMT